ncbi:MAG: hypothetical protein ABIH78_01195 [Candidatus Peregrinibacteria bacterium]
MPEAAKTIPATPINPLDVKASASTEKESGVIENIVSTETSKGEERILEEAPELDVSLLREIAPPKSLLLLVLKVVFGVLVAAGASAILFFTSQLTTTFDFLASKFGIPNISKELASSNSEITSLQTDLNLSRYLQIKGDLDRLSFYGDSYVRDYEVANSQTSENTDKKAAVDDLAVLRDQLREIFMAVKDNAVLDISAPLVDKEIADEAALTTLFEQELVSKLTEKSTELADSSDPQAKRDYKNYRQTINLVGNSALRNLVVQTDFDSLSDKDLYIFIKSLNAVIVNDLSIIQKIKDMRIKWSDIINEIDLRTMAVDSYYSENYYDEIGGIRYVSYDFDSANQSISIVGETKRFDTNNFTMIANLIDELNSSSLFKNAEMKSFSKSGSTDTGYTASLKLSLDLEPDDTKIN